MGPDNLPEGLIARFRTLSLERVGRIESTWNALAQGVHNEEPVREMMRDLHTLKGDARIVGFEEVHLLSQKLEDLVALGAQRRYEVSEDFELVVTMALQFLGILLRKKSGSSMSGIDLVGFVRQVDEVLRETRALPVAPRIVPGKGRQIVEVSDRLSESTRQRLAIAATATFLEYLGARGATSRTRLRGIWHTLREELSRMHAVALSPLLERHIHGTCELAEELGKRITIEIEADNVLAESRVAEAVDIAVLHLFRNVVDHGIELPAVRVASGKPERGTVRVFVREIREAIEIIVEDDGGGIDLDLVRARGLERGLIPPTAHETDLLELLFHPGFSTRNEVTPISGRGVGMDAVRAALAKVGGTVGITSRFGTSSQVTITVPAPVRQLHAYQFMAPGGAVRLAVSARWTPTVEATPAADALDPISAIQLLGSSRQTIVGVPSPTQELAIRLHWGFLEVALLAATGPTLVIAERICPTPDDYPIEVVSVDGHETLLLRPEHVASLATTAALADR